MFGAFTALADLAENSDADSIATEDTAPIDETLYTYDNRSGDDDRDQLLQDLLNTNPMESSHALRIHEPDIKDFAPDTLCTSCQSIFGSQLGTTGSFKMPGLIHVESASAAHCQLCATLLDKWQLREGKSASLEIEYWLEIRRGYFMGVKDIVFSPKPAIDYGPASARFGIQLVNDTNPNMPLYSKSMPRSTRIEHSSPQIHKWLTACEQEHKGCNKGLETNSFIPSRLIKITRGREGQNTMQISLVTKLENPVRYATLSHRWGDYMPVKLLKENLEEYKQAIPFEEISLVFRDAMNVAEIVNIWYLWIDSLCIIQDCDEDWHKEAAMMSEIYFNCHLNISADGFLDGSMGLFVERDTKILRPAKVRIGADVQLHVRSGDVSPIRAGDYYLVDVNSWKDEIDDAPLGTRGWVVQERALSRRTLHFGRTQVSWECFCSTMNEVFQHGFLSGTVIRRLKELPITSEAVSGRHDQGFREIRFIIHDMDRAHGTHWGKSIDSAGGKAEIDEIMFHLIAQYHWRRGDHSRLYWQSEEMQADPIKKAGRNSDDFDTSTVEDTSELRAKIRKWHGSLLPNSDKPSPIKRMTAQQISWCSLVEAYSSCFLTFSKDKLIAIAGLAQRLSREMKCDYLAGLWRKDLEHFLLWKVSKVSTQVCDIMHRGPSWSWASVDGAIKYNYWRGDFLYGYLSEIEWLARVESVDIDLATSHLFGAVSGGLLVMTGALGVLRMPQNQNAGDHNPQNNTTTIQCDAVRISWDNQQLPDQFSQSQHDQVQIYKRYSVSKGAFQPGGTRDVFSMPIRLMEYDYNNLDYEMPMLEGLLLFPDARCKGLYRRVGHFSVSEQQTGGIASVVAFKHGTEIVNADFFQAVTGDGRYTISIS